MNIKKFSEHEKGVLFNMLMDAYSSSSKLVENYKNDWEEFDAFVFNNLKIMDNNGFISYEGSRPIGFMSWDSRQLPDQVEIGHNCIIGEFKGRGLGKMQLAVGLERIQTLGPRRVLVTTGAAEFFESARGMYEALGFVRSTRQPRSDLVDYELVMANAASGNLEEAHSQLMAYTIVHARNDPTFIHQLGVDAWAAQHAGSNSKPIAVAFALIGLYLHLEKGFTGKEVQDAHVKLARNRRQWPQFELPVDRGKITVYDVLAKSPGGERDMMIEKWCISIWDAYDASHERVIELVQQELYRRK
jgi:GNAT superfamily N-acetyltransferase